MDGSNSTIAASAVAARAFRYPGLAALIEAEGLSPSHIATLFDMSASKSAAHDCAVIVLAGAVGRYRVAPLEWNGAIEHALALNALALAPDPAAAVGLAGAKAAKLVERNWAAITSGAAAA
jgi:hypothetical protein